MEYHVPENTNAQLQVFNSGGIKVKEIQLVQSKGTVIIPTEHWNVGTYTCNLIVNDKSIKIEKIVFTGK